MEKSILVLTLIFGWSCQSPTAVDSPGFENLSGKQPGIVDTSSEWNYNKAFLDGLNDTHPAVKIIGENIVVGLDTFGFPKDLPLNRENIFTGTRDSTTYILTVTRFSLTDLQYKIECKNPEAHRVGVLEGKAILTPQFFLASEVDEDDETGDAYGSNEYLDKSGDNWIAIRIGIGKDEKGNQRARVNYGGEPGAGQVLTLDNCPTLRNE